MKRLIANAVLLSATLVATTLFVSTTSTAVAAGGLTVERPKWGRELIGGKTYFIRWINGGGGATVKIELRKAGKHYKWITKKTKNDGEYIWKIPTSVARSSRYKIRITSTKNPSISDERTDVFTILKATKWWKRRFEGGDAVSIGIEDDGSGSWDDFIVHGNNPHNRYCVDVVNKKAGHPVRKGKQSIRFEVRPGQCGGGDCGTNESERCELIVDAGSLHGNEYWYAWSVYFKNFKPISPVSPTVGQFKPMSGLDTAIEFITFYVSQNGLEAFFTIDRVTTSYPVVSFGKLSNKWHDIVVNSKFSTRADGFVKIWANGKLVVNRKGRNVVDKDDRYFRFGFYRSNLYRTSNRNITHIAYYDELVRGSSCEDVSQFMTCPGGSSLKVTSPNGKEKWKTKKKYTIKWKKGKAGTYVKIQLLKKGKLYRTIKAKTKNDGKHAWRVPSTLVKSAAYKVKITSTKNKKLTDSSNNNFTITK